MGRYVEYVKSFRIDYERDENWRTFYPNRNFQNVSKSVYYALARSAMQLQQVEGRVLVRFRFDFH